MQQSDNQAEASELPADVDAALDAALEKAGVNVEQKAIQDAATAEEAHAARVIKQSQAAQTEPQAESLVHVMAKGRDHLLQRMRDHAAQAAAKKEEYTPPPITDRQRQNLLEEQEAGKRATARHQAELTNRPPPPVREKWDGTNTPVHRPGSLVPDPALPAGSFAAGTKQYSADA